MNSTGKGGFGERKHQINRRGRPRSFNSLRKLAQKIAHEDTADGITVIEDLLAKWTTSKEPQLQIKFVEIAYGKASDTVEVTGKDGGPVETAGSIAVRFIDYRAGIATATATET